MKSKHAGFHASLNGYVFDAWFSDCNPKVSSTRYNESGDRGVFILMENLNNPEQLTVYAKSKGCHAEALEDLGLIVIADVQNEEERLKFHEAKASLYGQHAIYAQKEYEASLKVFERELRLCREYKPQEALGPSLLNQ
ncbi:MAG: hypothetical protein IBX55_00825 [Methyloprofundus sp.]|nr:hypothetical protein [Methyloprofundus sp.]